MPLWITLGIAYAALGVLVVGLAFRLCRGEAPTHRSLEARLKEIEKRVKEDDVPNLRSLVMQSLAESAERDDRIQEAWIVTRQSVDELRSRTRGVQADVGFLVRRSEAEMIDEWARAERERLGGA